MRFTLRRALSVGALWSVACATSVDDSNSLLSEVHSNRQAPVADGGGDAANVAPLAPGAPATPGPLDAGTAAPNTGTATAGIGQFPGSKIFMPPHTPAPAILMLHGSEGGQEHFMPDLAAEIAQKGFVVVAFCWFGCPGTPTPLFHVALDRTVAAGKWLKASADVTAGRVGLLGWSRGGEQAVLLASLLATKDPFMAVFAHAPSDTIVGSFDPATEDAIAEVNPQTGQSVPGAAWSWNGALLFGETTSDFSTAGPRILVERYPGPFAISAGVNDEVWDVGRSRNIVNTRNAAGLVTAAHFWPGEGHVLRDPGNIAQWHQEIADFFERKLQ